MENIRVETLTAVVPVSEFTAECVDVPKFLELCRQCPNYGRIWACPPLPVDPMEIWNRYHFLHLYARVLIPRKEMDCQMFLQQFRREKQELSQYVLELEKQTPGSLSMAASTCIACTPCLRTQAKPCCHPEQLRYSIEALGGDVGLVMEKYLHRPLQWIKDGQLPEYLTVAAGLLTTDE